MAQERTVQGTVNVMPAGADLQDKTNNAPNFVITNHSYRNPIVKRDDSR
jgi:hypothetical protein